MLQSGTSSVISMARDFIDRSPSEDENNKIQQQGKSSSKDFQSIIRRTSSAYSTTFGLYLYLLSYEKSLEMIMDTAQHYYDSASNYLDADIELCKVCLNLLQNPKETKIAQMFDLIDAVKIINKEFNLNILPQTGTYYIFELIIIILIITKYLYKFFN
jgi:hypothetical protein